MFNIRESDRFESKDAKHVKKRDLTNKTAKIKSESKDQSKFKTVNSNEVILSGPGVVELRGWGSEADPVDLWEFCKTDVEIYGQRVIVCLVCDCQIGLCWDGVDVEMESINGHLRGKHHSRNLSESKYKCAKKDVYAEDCNCTHKVDSSSRSSKKVRFSLPSKDIVNDNRCYGEKLRKSKIMKANDSGVLDKENKENLSSCLVRRYKDEFKAEQVAHVATKEQVKHLKAKISCLNSDNWELETQLSDMEEKMTKVAEENKSKMNTMKLFLIHKQKQIQDLESAVNDKKLENVQNDYKQSIDKCVQTEVLVDVVESKKSNVEVAVQTDLVQRFNEALVLEDVNNNCDMSSGEHEQTSLSDGQIDILTDISVLANEVLQENASLRTFLADAEIERKLVDKENKKLRNDLRGLETKLLRVTVDNMHLKRENYVLKQLNTDVPQDPAQRKLDLCD